MRERHLMTPSPARLRVRAAACALAACAVCLAGPAPEDPGKEPEPMRRVFAHYMVCIPAAGGDATIEDYKQEIREAQSRGIDGFALNCGGWTLREPHYKARSILIYEAARQLDTRFLLFFSADFATGLAFEEAADMIETFAAHPNQFRHGGKTVLSTFAGEGADNRQGAEFCAFLDERFADGGGGRTVFFVPYFYPRPNITELPGPEHARQLLDTFPGLDGYFYFGAAGTGEQLAAANGVQARAWKAAGKVFMASVTPYYRGLGGNYRVYETCGFEGLAAEWESAIRNGADWVEIVTWNDWGEASYVARFGPPDRTELWNGHWGAMLSHEGFLDASRYYIEWFRTGTPPAITRDELFYAYRLHPKTVLGRVKPGEEGTGRPSGADHLEDTVFVTCFLTAPGRVAVEGGGETTVTEVEAGVSHLRVPARPGRQRFVLTRGGTTILEKVAEHPIGQDAATNFNIFAGSATAP